MAKLYEIAEEFKNLQQLIEENEGDEVLIRLVKEALNTKEVELQEKLKAICYILKNQESEIKEYKEEEKRLSIQRKILEKKNENLKDYLFYAMKENNIKKSKAGTFNLSVRKTPPKLIIDNEEEISENYRVVKFEYDKTSLKNDLKEGKEVKGVHLESGESLTIK